MGICFFKRRAMSNFQGEKKNKKDKRHIDNFYEFSPEQSSQFDPNFVGASFGWKEFNFVQNKRQVFVQWGKKNSRKIFCHIGDFLKSLSPFIILSPKYTCTLI